MLQISSSEDAITCFPVFQNPNQLQCRSFTESYVVPQSISAVANPNPDFQGPNIQSIDYDSENRSLAIHASDQSGLYIAQIFAGERSVIVYADSLNKGESVSLASAFSPGWNTIDRIVVFDVNGAPTLLRVKDSLLGPYKAKPKSKKRAAVKEQETYELVTSDGHTSDTSIPVISHLEIREAR